MFAVDPFYVLHSGANWLHEIQIDERSVRIRNVTDAVRRYRVGYASEDRKAEGLILQLGVAANIAATA